MVLFEKFKAGGLMDEIRCDEPSYLIWKWHPAGSQARNNNRENAIRWGSSLRVKDGEVAVFVYSQKDGPLQDFIEGPFDRFLETDNLPVYASIVGLAYQGGTPFQAEIYFINLAKVIQVPFAVPFFDLYDSRFPDIGVPTAVRGKITFNIADYREFIQLHRLIDFNLTAFQRQIRDAVSRYVKGIVLSIIGEKNIPVVQIEKEIETINEMVEVRVRERLGRDFGVDVTSVDINSVEIDKTSEGYYQLKAVTQELAARTAQAQAEANIRNIQDMQRMNAENLAENMRIQREEAQYAQRKQTQMSNFAAYQLEQQASVGIAGAEALGKMGVNGATEMTGGGLNPAAMMSGLAMGTAIGQNMAGMMTGMMHNMNGHHETQMNETTPPPIPVAKYHVAINGKAEGPFDMSELEQMTLGGTLTENSLVWKSGMANWAKAGDILELHTLFAPVTPPIPDVPPTPSE